MRSTPLNPIAACAALSCLLLSGCGGGSDGGTEPPPAADSPPDAVIDLAVAATGADGVTLTWSAPADPDGGGADTYELRHGSADDAGWTDWTPAAGLPAPAAPGEREIFAVGGLAAGSPRLFRLRSRDAEGNWSRLSNTVAGVPGSVAGRTWRVAVDGSGDAPTIQAAIDSATAGDLVLVGPGRYTWSNQGSGNDYGMIRFLREVQHIVLRSETGAAATVIDAESQGRVMLIQGYNNGVVIDGFTITGGVAPENGYYNGGGIEAHLTAATVRNCIITGNVAHRLTGDNGGQGGGVWWGGVSAMSLEACIITDNAADSGGGVALINSSDLATISHCIISRNQAGYTGGGIWNANFAVDVLDCVIARNTAVQSGGGYFGYDVNPSRIVRCTLVRNETQAGAGIRINSGEPLEVTRSIIAFSPRGEAFSSTNATLRVGCCILYGNFAGPGLDAVTDNLGNIVQVDPLFCDVEHGDYALQAGSPAAAGGVGACGQLGALPIGCGR